METTTTIERTVQVEVPVTKIENIEVVTHQLTQVGTKPVTVTSTDTRLVGYDRVVTEDVFETREVLQWYVSQHTNWYQSDAGDWAALTCAGNWPWDLSYGWISGAPQCGGHDYVYSNDIYHYYHSHEDVWGQQVVGYDSVYTGTRSYVQRFPTAPGTPVWEPYTFTWVRYDPIYALVPVIVLVPTVTTTIELRTETEVVTVPVNRCVRPT